MKNVTIKLSALLTSLTLTACLPSGGDSGGGVGGGGGGGGLEDTGFNNGTDAGDPNNAANNQNNPVGKTCPDGTVIPVEDSCGACPTTIEDCDDGGAACTTISFTPGTPCGTCTISQINQCGVFDGCCPAGCAPDEDDDCAGCGDGQLDPGEACDGNCPRNVNDCPDTPNACTTYAYSGSADSCTARCVEQAITSCSDFDGCCPSGCSSTSDNDCAPPAGTARHGDTCLSNEAACARISQATQCISQADINLIDPIVGMLVNQDGICTPLDCASNDSCQDGTVCVSIQGLFPIGAPISACLRPCLEANQCDGNMTCTSVNLLDMTGPTYCI